MLRIFLALIVAFYIFANELQEAQRLLQSHKRANILKAYNIYRSQYIKSLLVNDTNLRIKALQGLTKAAKALGEPYRGYQKELYTLLNHSFKKKRHYKKPKVVYNRVQKVLLHRGYIEIFFDYPLKKSDIHLSKKSAQIIYTVNAKLWKKKVYRLKDRKRLILLPLKKKVRIILKGNHLYAHHLLKSNRLLIYLSRDRAKHGVAKATPSQSPKVIHRYKKVIVIDPGHGGKDTGAIGYGHRREKDAVLAIAKKLYTILKRRGYRVYMTRKGDYFVTLRNRTRFANKVKANLFISIHANAAPKGPNRLKARGLETFFLSPARSARAKRVAALENRVYMKNLSYFSKQVALDFLNREKTILSNKLAIDIQRNILAKLRQKFRVIDGGVRPGPFWVLVGTQMPSILIETGYITNPTEARLLNNPYYQKLMAEGIANGVESYFIHNGG